MFLIKNAKVIILTFSVVALSGLIGGTILLYTHTIDPPWNPFKPALNQVMANALDKMKELKSFKASVNYSQDGDKNADLGWYDVKVSYSSDRNDLSNTKTAIGFELNTYIDDMPITLAVETKNFNNSNYLKVTTLPKFPFDDELEGKDLYFIYFGVDVNKIKDQWIKYNYDSYKELMKSVYGLDEEEEKEMDEGFSEWLNALKGIISKFEQFLKNKETYIVKKQLPSENTNAQGLSRYLLVLNIEEAKKLFNQTFSDVEADMIKNFIPGLSLSKAKDSRVISVMSQMRIVATFIFSNYEIYDGFSCSSEDMPALCNEVKKQTGKEPTIFAKGSDFCAFSPLSVDGYYHCIDGQGNARTTKDPQTLGNCDGKTFICPIGAEIIKEDREAMARKRRIEGINNFFDQVGEFPIEVSIGKKDGFLHQVKINREIDLSKFGSSQKEKINFDIVVDFSDFNQDLKIEEPKEFQTIAQALTPPVPEIIYPPNNSEVYSIAPAILLGPSYAPNFYVFAFEEGVKTSLSSQNTGDWLTWAVMDGEYGGTTMKGLIGKFKWGNDYTFFTKACRDKELTICSPWSEPLYFKIPVGNGKFIESDKGRDYNTKGRVIYEQYSKEGVVINGKTIKDYFGAMEDKCLFDFTDNPADKNILLEYYKTGNLNNPVALEQYKCPKGCKNGVCVK